MGTGKSYDCFGRTRAGARSNPWSECHCHGAASLGRNELGAAGQAERRQARLIFERHLSIGAAQANNPAVVEELGRIAELPHLTGTAAAVSSMAARLGGGNDRLAEQVRARENAAESYLAQDQLLVAAIAAVKRERASKLQHQLAELIQQIKQRDAVLARDFPAYAELTRAEQLTRAICRGL